MNQKAAQIINFSTVTDENIVTFCKSTLEADDVL